MSSSPPWQLGMFAAWRVRNLACWWELWEKCGNSRNLLVNPGTYPVPLRHSLPPHSLTHPPRHARPWAAVCMLLSYVGGDWTGLDRTGVVQSGRVGNAKVPNVIRVRLGAWGLFELLRLGHLEGAWD